MTNPTLLLNKRLQQTFRDAAVSITITSLTDIISFGVGCLTPFPSVYVIYLINKLFIIYNILNIYKKNFK